MTPLRETLLRQYDDVQRGTKRLIALIPSDRWEWAPAPGMMTLRQLAGHLAVIAQTSMRGLAMGRWEMPPTMADVTRESALAQLDESIAQTHRLLDSIGDAEFEQRTITTPWGAEMTVARAFAAVIEHDIHHRTQLFLYLKILGTDIHSLTLFG